MHKCRYLRDILGVQAFTERNKNQSQTILQSKICEIYLKRYSGGREITSTTDSLAERMQSLCVCVYELGEILETSSPFHLSVNT